MPAKGKSQTKEQLQMHVAGVRTGGKGTVRRKRKVVHKTASGDDKRVMQTLQHLPHFTPLSGIEEANIFTKNGDVIHFENPKVCASQEAATTSISGHNETKSKNTPTHNILTNFNQLTYLFFLNFRASGAPSRDP